MRTTDPKKIPAKGLILEKKKNEFLREGAKVLASTHD